MITNGMAQKASTQTTHVWTRGITSQQQRCTVHYMELETYEET